MPSRARLDEFIAVVEAGDHAGAIERYYTEDSSMQENAAPPRVGRDLLVAHERGVLARMTHVYSKAMSSVVEGDNVFTGFSNSPINPGKYGGSTRSRCSSGAATRYSASVSSTIRPRRRLMRRNDTSAAVEAFHMTER